MHAGDVVPTLLALALIWSLILVICFGVKSELNNRRTCGVPGLDRGDEAVPCIEQPFGIDFTRRLLRNQWRATRLRWHRGLIFSIPEEVQIALVRSSMEAFSN
jgi:hypothetical protein